jgi:hypothetical protein
MGPNRRAHERACSRRNATSGPSGLGLVRMDEGWSRPPCGVRGSLGRRRSGPIALGWGPESPASIGPRRGAPLLSFGVTQNAPVWRACRITGAPKNTPAQIVERLNREINEALADPKVKSRLVDLGGTVLEGSATDLGVSPSEHPVPIRCRQLVHLTPRSRA